MSASSSAGPPTLATATGGNKGLKALRDADPERARHFQFSLLRVFGPSVPMAEVNDAEEHSTKALLSRKFGLNHI